MARAARSGSRLDTGLLIACVLLALFATVLPLPVREAIASSLRRTVVAPILGLQERAVRARNAFVERDLVMARYDSLALRVTEMRELEAENVQLRGLLALGRKLRFGFLPAEALHGDDDFLTLTVGSQAGAKTGAAVIAPDGLVGKVTTVDPGSSIAIMWTHRDFRASAMSSDGKVFGIVRAHVSAEGSELRESRNTPERYLLEIRGVAFRDTLRPGARIATSGLGGVFPRGIPIGTVLGEIKTSEQWSRTYLMRPAVRPQDVTNVMMLLPQRSTDSLEVIWRSESTAESMIRSIASSGDSLLRRATFDSLAAAEGRRRAADSAAALLRPSPNDTSSAGSGAPPVVKNPAATSSTSGAPRVPARTATPSAARAASRVPTAPRRDSVRKRP
ncbi:MAG: rod shape-determining protein MreC [Gemmatimonadaceae bacterium]